MKQLATITAIATTVVAATTAAAAHHGLSRRAARTGSAASTRQARAAAVDQPAADRYTRGPVTRWRVGDRYLRRGRVGHVTRVDNRLVFGSAVYWSLRGYELPLWVEELQEIPGQSYDRIAARTFNVPAQTISYAHGLAELLCRELKTLWEEIPGPVRMELLEDYAATGYRGDHPAAPFITHMRHRYQDG